MRKKTFLMILFGSAFLLMPSRVLAQDSDKVVILSPRVGAAIDASERDRFRLFPQIEGFKQAVIYKTPNNTYYIVIISVTPDGNTKETTVGYRESDLLALAERIEHFEDLEKGIYHMGQQPATLGVADRQGQAVMQQPDLLPFAAHAGEFELESYPNWGFGIGLSTYSPDFSGLNAAFGAIEDKYRNQGYSVAHHTVNFDPSPCLWLNVKIRLSRTFALLLEAGTTTFRRDIGSSVDDQPDYASFKALSASVLYHFRLSETTWLRPYVGAGLGQYYFKVAHRYENVVPNQYLVISSQGGNTGFQAVAGVELSPREGPSLSLYAKYLFIPTVETTTAAGVKANVDLSSIVGGAGISFYF
jgi:opacity protein-like surface antigen